SSSSASTSGVTLLGLGLRLACALWLRLLFGDRFGRCAGLGSLRRSRRLDDRLWPRLGLRLLHLRLLDLRLLDLRLLGPRLLPPRVAARASTRARTTTLAGTALAAAGSPAALPHRAET